MSAAVEEGQLFEAEAEDADVREPR